MKNEKIYSQKLISEYGEKLILYMKENKNLKTQIKDLNITLSINKEMLNNQIKNLSIKPDSKNQMSEIISSLRAAAILHKSHVTLRSTHHKWLNNLAIAIPVTNTLKMANLTYYISHDPLYTTLRIHL
jgi:hypothetical protein